MQAGVFWGVVALAAGWSARVPDLNWDGIAYVALALERGGATPAEAHRLAYGHLRELATDARYEELTEESAYRARMAQDASAFSETLSFYRMRQGYVGLLAGVHRWVGGNPFWVPVAIGAAAYLLLAWALWAWMGAALVPLWSGGREQGVGASVERAGLGRSWLRLLPLVLLLQPTVLGSISLATPDFLAAALLVVGAFQVLSRRQLGAGALFLLLAVLSRPDTVLLACPLLLVPALAQAIPDGVLARPMGFRLDGKVLLRHRWSIACAMGLAGVGGAVVLGSDAHPWGVVFRHTFLEHVDDPGAAASVGIIEYAKVVATAVVFLGSGKPARILFCLATVGVGYLLWHPLVPRDRKLLAVVAWASWIGFFFLFPLPLERFYVAHSTLIGLALLRTFGELALAARALPHPVGLGLLSLLRGRSVEGERLLPLPRS